MTTAVALCEAARSIFSLKVQFPRWSKAIHCLVLGGTWKRVRGSQPRRSATEVGNNSYTDGTWLKQDKRKEEKYPKTLLQALPYHLAVTHQEATILLLIKP